MGSAGSVKQRGGMLSLLSSSIGILCSNQLAVGALPRVDLQLWGLPSTSSNLALLLHVPAGLSALTPGTLKGSTRGIGQGWLSPINCAGLPTIHFFFLVSFLLL